MMKDNQSEFVGRKELVLRQFRAQKRALIIENKRHPSTDEALPTKVWEIARGMHNGFLPLMGEGRTLAEMRDVIVKRYANSLCKLEKEGRSEPSIARFERVCLILRDIIAMSATAADLSCLVSDAYPLALSLLADGVLHKGKKGVSADYHLRRDDQDRMVAGIKSVLDARDELFARVGMSGGSELLSIFSIPESLSGINDLAGDERFYEYLFRGDRDRAVFNPDYFRRRADEIVRGIEPLNDPDFAPYITVADFYDREWLYNCYLKAFSISRSMFSNPLKFQYDVEDGFARSLWGGNGDAGVGCGKVAENRGGSQLKGKQKCVNAEKRKGRTEDYFSHRKGCDLIDGRVVVSEKGDMLTIKNKGQEYEIKAKSQDFWETVEGLIDWYADEMKGCKGKSDKLLRARELSDEKGRIVPDGKRIRNAIGTLFRRDFGPDVKKEILFRFTTEGCKGTPECYVNFARDLFLSGR